MVRVEICSRFEIKYQNIKFSFLPYVLRTLRTKGLEIYKPVHFFTLRTNTKRD